MFALVFKDDHPVLDADGRPCLYATRQAALDDYRYRLARWEGYVTSDPCRVNVVLGSRQDCFGGWRVFRDGAGQGHRRVGAPVRRRGGPRLRVDPRPPSGGQDDVAEGGQGPRARRARPPGPRGEGTMATYIVTPSVGIVAGGLILDAIRNEVVGVVGLRLTWRDDRPGYDLGVEVDLDWTDRRTAEATVAGVMGRFDRGAWEGRWSDRGQRRPRRP